MKLPIVKHILVFTTWGQKCPHSEPEQFTFDNFQSNHPVYIDDSVDNLPMLPVRINLGQGGS